MITTSSIYFYKLMNMLPTSTFILTLLTHTQYYKHASSHTYVAKFIVKKKKKGQIIYRFQEFVLCSENITLVQRLKGWH